MTLCSISVRIIYDFAVRAKQHSLARFAQPNDLEQETDTDRFDVGGAMSDNQIEPNILVSKVGKALHITSSPNAPAFYTNIAGLAMGPEEVILNFGLTNPDNPNEAAEVVRIYMSPGHAKRLAIALQQYITQYESMFGIIVHDPSETLTPEGRKMVGLPEK